MGYDCGESITLRDAFFVQSGLGNHDLFPYFHRNLLIGADSNG